MCTLVYPRHDVVIAPWDLYLKPTVTCLISYEINIHGSFPSNPLLFSCTKNAMSVVESRLASSTAETLETQRKLQEMEFTAIELEEKVGSLAFKLYDDLFIA